MKKIKITTPENIEVEYDLAGLGSRSAAACIDLMIQGIALVLLVVAVLLIKQYSTNFWEEYYGWVIGISLIIYALISYGSFIVMELTMNGMTIGKKIFNIRTIRDNGQPITLKHSAIRNLIRVFIDVFGIGVVFMFFTKNNKRLGDFAASTIVVIEEDKTNPITLESLQNANENFRYYITDEEYEVVKEYLQRKNHMENYEELRIELKNHFTKKFEKLGLLEEMRSFVEAL